MLDTTVPSGLEARIDKLDLERCLFFIASKSGSTIEPNAILELLHARLREAIGAQAAGRRFVAITDPGSALETRAAELGFLGIAYGRADVGGRFSALSAFGLLPAEAMGLDPEALLGRARRMSAACAAFVSPERNPGVALGLALGVLARQGRDKLTLSTSPQIAAFPSWITQLIAESTGKSGHGIVPVDGEALTGPEAVAKDRVFVDIALELDATRAQRESKLSALEAAGHPVIRIQLTSPLDLVQEVFRWELATAVVGALLELNPFDQPDVEAAKSKSRDLMAQASDGQSTAAHAANLEIDGLQLFAAPALARAVSGKTDPSDWMRALIRSLGDGDVFIMNVFLEGNDAIRRPLEALRSALRQAHKNATTLAFGPRYLHSSGQLQKGGPNRFVGLQLWQSAASRAGQSLEIPHLGGTFDTLVEAQAVGDFAVLAERGRRVIGIDVGSEPEASLAKLTTWV
ncbi:MAG: transaldolase, partial [Deltaproteobacteria bacterium]|nr:transaldolase [Deltaproteobacteria bacterium]